MSTRNFDEIFNTGLNSTFGKLTKEIPGWADCFIELNLKLLGWLHTQHTPEFSIRGVKWRVEQGADKYVRYIIVSDIKPANHACCQFEIDGNGARFLESGEEVGPFTWPTIFHYFLNGEWEPVKEGE